jgi:SPP1 gp7 family putative phage head morphogenesis protein
VPKPPPDPNLVARAIGAAARRRVSAALARLSRADRWLAPNVARAELLRLEPLLARALTDAQLLEYLEAARRIAEGTVPEAEVSTPDSPESQGESHGTEPPARPAEPDDPAPLVRYPQIERAAADLMARNVMLPGDFDKLTEEAKRNAFTVTRATTLDAVERVREAVRRDLEEGGTRREFGDRVEAALGSGALADHELDALYRTQTARAAAAGQRAVLDDPLVQSEFVYLLWSATHDGRVEPDHLAMEKAGLNGTAVYRADDPIFNTHFPPIRWNCRCIVIPLSVADAAEYGCAEARRWLETGEPPAQPEFVGEVPAQIPPGWVPVARGGIGAAV